MKSSKKQSVAIAMATVLSVSTVASPIALQAQENDTAIAQEVENTQPVVEKAVAPEIVLPTNLQATAGATLAQIQLPEGWSWADASTALSTDLAEYPAYYRVDDETYTYDAVAGYNAQGHYVETLLTVVVETPVVETAVETQMEEPALTPVETPMEEVKAEVIKEDTEIEETTANKETKETKANEAKDIVVSIDEKQFPNEAFRTVVIDALNKNNLTADQIDQIETISIPTRKDINNLNGIEYLTNLKVLNCSGTSIQSLDVTQNTKLDTLNCYDNPNLTSLTLGNSDALVTLQCNNTGISELNVGSKTKLKTLNCANTKIPTLDLAGFTNLDKLKCDGNAYLTSLNVSGAKALTTLEFDNNPELNTLVLDGATALKKLDCNSNPKLEVLNVSGATALNELNCSNTAISLLNVDSSPYLTKLNCSKTAISSLNVNNNAALQELDCSETAIESLDLNNNIELTNLACHDNTNLNSLIVNGALALQKMNCFNTGIISLDVSKNKSLSYFDCSRNSNLQSLDVSGAEDLRKLFCYGTSISSLDVSNNKILTWLSCGSNKALKDLNVRGTIALKLLSCCESGLTSLDVSQNMNLEDLQCEESSNLTTLALKGATILKKLNISDTAVTDLDVSQNAKLEDLHCQNTKMTNLDVRKNVKLASLDCNGNLFGYIDLGENEGLIAIEMPEFASFNLDTTEDSFNIQDLFKGINISKVHVTEGAKYDSTTGVVSDYSKELGRKIRYTYDCGKAGSSAKTLEVTLIRKKQSTITISENLDKVYDGKAVNDQPKLEKNESNGKVSYVWEKKNNEQWESIDSAPMDAGTYRVTAHIESNDLFTATTSKPKEFTISQADNSFTKELAILGWSVGDAASAPNATAKFGTVIYAYSDSVDGTFTVSVPSTAGTWYVKASVVGTDNYTGLSSDVVSFVIQPEKADTPTGTTTKNDSTKDDGKKSSDKKEDNAVNTGDTTSTSLWAILMAGAIGVLAVLKSKKHSIEE